MEGNKKLMNLGIGMTTAGFVALLMTGCLADGVANGLISPIPWAIAMLADLAIIIAGRQLTKHCKKKNYRGYIVYEKKNIA